MVDFSEEDVEVEDGEEAHLRQCRVVGSEGCQEEWHLPQVVSYVMLLAVDSPDLRVDFPEEFHL